MRNKNLLIIEKMLALHNRIVENDKKPRHFGIDQLLYQSEIHFIEIIGNNEEMNASQISCGLGITNGAVTQVAEKLMKKKLVEKYKSGTNKKEVYFRLTESGKIAHDNHNKYHQELYKKVIEYLDSLNQDQIEGLEGLIATFENYLP